MALQLLTERLHAISGHVAPSVANGTPASASDGVVWVDSIVSDPVGKRWGNQWGNPGFVLDEFGFVNKCAYFDYQRDVIRFRAPGRARKKRPSRKRAKPKSVRPTAKTVITARKCPFCKGSQLTRDYDRAHWKNSYDLRLLETGIRRVVTRYITTLHRCQECGRAFLPPRYKRQEKFLHTLQSWAMYQHVVNRTTFENLEGIFKECFGLPVRFSIIHAFKASLAKFYRPTYEQLLRTVLNGHLLQCDETGVRLQRGKGCVWVFTNLVTVVFQYRDTRKGDFLKTMLEGFRGVLISDFYSAYDSLPYPQQKCLVHLIRDLNTDLRAHWEDDEMRWLTNRFGKLLAAIVQTIDRYGLQQEYLTQHKAEVAIFFRELAEQEFQSVVVKQYQKRLLKYQEKLFVFVDHDGVPWNNNNAEHAVKHFAKYRMITNGRMTERGVADYLVLLSIYQTCEYRGVSFLRFLLSGSRNLDKFCESQKI